MKYLSHLSIILGFLFCSVQLFGQNGGANCAQAVPLCTNPNIPTQATNPGGTPSSGACGCLATTPNPQWYVLQASSGGNLSINLSQTTQANNTPIDIDYILFGPITNMATACNNPCQLPVASCSYSAAAVENITASNVQTGQVFLLMVTNFNGQPSNISMTNNSAVQLNCAIGTANNGGPYCAGQTISLTGGLPIGANPANFGFNWTGPNGFTSNLQNPTIPNATTANGGVYSFTVTQGATSNTYTTTVVIKPNPTAALTATQQICLGDVATFNASASTPIPGINTFQWIFNNSGVINQTTSVPNTQYTYPVAGTYNTGVIVTMNGCKDTANFQVVVSPKPTAAFTMATQGCENKTVTLNGSTSTVAAPSTIVEYQWDYNNDGNADEVTLTPTSMHAFPVGNHTVKLTVRTNNGCMAATTKAIEILPYPLISFDFNNACAGATTQFTNTSTVVSPYNMSYNWDFGVGAGGYTSTQANPSFTYPGLGTYDVSLEVTANNLCKDTLVKELIINNDVTAAFSFNEPCNLTGIYTDESFIPAGASGTINGWGWSFGDGGISTDQNPTHVYQLGNIYDVTLIVSTVEGCFDTLTQAVPKYPIPVAAFSAANVCQNFVTEFIDSSVISSGIIQACCIFSDSEVTFFLLAITSIFFAKADL
jgi:PKD repeat protein